MDFAMLPADCTRYRCASNASTLFWIRRDMLFLLEERGSVVPGPAPCEPTTPGLPGVGVPVVIGWDPGRLRPHSRESRADDYGEMSVVDVLSRIAQIEALSTRV